MLVENCCFISELLCFRYVCPRFDFSFRMLRLPFLRRNSTETKVCDVEHHNIR